MACELEAAYLFHKVSRKSTNKIHRNCRARWFDAEPPK